MLIKPANAGGAVNPTVTYWGGTHNSKFNCNGMSSVSAIQNCVISAAAQALADDRDWLVARGAGNIPSCPAAVLEDFGPTGNYVDYFAMT